uniref:Uncharacterized protein n=1 Tax=Arundo donax TaxID=35708 RepID=A0A0A9DXP7_ARUDO
MTSKLMLSRGPQAKSFSSSHVRLNLSVAFRGPLKLFSFSIFFFSLSDIASISCLGFSTGTLIAFCSFAVQETLSVRLHFSLYSTATLVAFACQTETV